MPIVLDGTAGITTPQVTTDDGEAYAPGNILGTVSQSGGVPTGAIIQRVTNANGELVRFADGTQICHLIRASGTLTFGAGQVITNVISTWDYPAAFTTRPNVNTTILAGFIFDFTGSFEGISATLASGFHVKNSSTTSRTVILTVSLLAIGRWF